MPSSQTFPRSEVGVDKRDKQDWGEKYTRRIAVVDAIVVVWATAGALVLRFGSASGASLVSIDGKPYVALSVALAILWWAMLGMWGARDPKVFGYGIDEFKRVFSASFWLFGLIALASYSFQLDTARGYIGVALPAGVLGLVIARALVRHMLRIERKQGRSTATVLVVGGPTSVEHLVRSLLSQPMAGYLPIATYLPQAAPGTTIDDKLGLPNLGYGTSVVELTEMIRSLAPDAVAFSSGVPLPPRTIRELGWALADLNIRMIMAPALTDIAGPRIHTQPLAGLPLIHVSTPNLAGWKRFTKRVFDLAGAITLIGLSSPILILTALLIRFDSPGPVLFKQNRVGAAGVPFRMLKFRSMIVDAEARLHDLQRLNEGNGVMFKMKADPRVTRVGRFIRRYSIDELPQLFNVLGGTMSLIGPRPPLPSEVETYETYMRRRLLVRPGLTGLWQVSGRSLLSWEDTIRLDLYYVENWSLAGDIAILLKTFRAVVSRHGAY
ncbi:sugar transferase [Arthrobacter sp. 08Y14]|uniref:sugar transferase n=1 Tax=Arthrobacter sp. 08Y14 TaxID=2058885 RepID=UPI000CE51BDC|nr:sugar transferase [Arthrobacter sp. 08Y14]